MRRIVIRQRVPLKRNTTPIRRKRPARQRSFLKDPLPPKNERGNRITLCHVELNEAGQVITILGSCHPSSCIRQDWIHRTLAEAVGELRHRIFLRSEGKCEHILPDGTRCNKTVTEEDGPHKGDMNERKHRGKAQDKGLRSMENSEFSCRHCHRVLEHGDRNPRLSWLPPILST
jgi:hypothetical protein